MIQITDERRFTRPPQTTTAVSADAVEHAIRHTTLRAPRRHVHRHSVAHARDALHRDEIDAAAAEHHSLHVHYVYSATDGLLTAERVMGVLRAGASPWIYICGPPAMTRSLARGFRRAGIPGRHIRSEDFGAR